MVDPYEIRLIQMQILANQNFRLLIFWLFLYYWINLQVFTEISRF